MKNKIEQELDQKEFENELGRDLQLEYHNLETEEQSLKGKNKYVIAGIHFFGTIIMCYIFVFLARMIFNMFFGAAIAMFGIDVSWINPLIHGAILILGIYSVYKKRSILDDFLNKMH
ncbi:MAG: hypothetical protein WD016_07955 [Balneolaceae bacterium]